MAYALQRALAAGALDAFAVPIVMKKGRPGQLLTVLCQPADVAALETLLFAETTTFGVRRSECRRSVLARAYVTVGTTYGDIRVKVGRRGPQVVQAWPEYEDCAAAESRCGRCRRQRWNSTDEGRMRNPGLRIQSERRCLRRQFLILKSAFCILSSPFCNLL